MPSSAVRRRRVDETESFFTLLGRMSGPAKTFLGGVALLGAAAVAWNQLDWWKPASVTYVDGKAQVLSTQIGKVGTETLQNRAETLTASKQRAEAEQADLKLKLQLAAAAKNAPPDYTQLLQSRLQFLTDQVTTLTNQINGIQQNIAHQTAEASK
jgi:hypothetical protein